MHYWCFRKEILSFCVTKIGYNRMRVLIMTLRMSHVVYISSVLYSNLYVLVSVSPIASEVLQYCTNGFAEKLAVQW